LAKDEALRERLGAAARQTVIARYTWRHNASRVFEAARAVTRGQGLSRQVPTI
jgi:hypothetical protein